MCKAGSIPACMSNVRECYTVSGRELGYSRTAVEKLHIQDSKLPKSEASKHYGHLDKIKFSEQVTNTILFLGTH